MKFHILADARGLSAIVAAGDELLVLSAGLLADPETVASLIERPVVLVQPAEAAAEAGFERIDLNYACAGAILIAGNLVEGLHDIPSDCDVASALTRLALQQGVLRLEVPAGKRAGTRWRMVENESQAHAIENEWLNHALGPRQSKSPGFFLARTAALTLGPSLLHSGNGGSVAALSVLAGLAIALGAGWIGMGALAFLACAIAWVLFELHRLLGKVEQQFSGSPVSALVRLDALGWLYDCAVVLLLTWLSSRGAGTPLAEHVFAPIMLILMLRIAPHNPRASQTNWIKDRAILATALAVAAILGTIPLVVQILAVGLAVAAIALRTGPTK
ncbi:MAG: hypothetical protein P8J20_10990 [Novosphingobium sp.]|nr:hypothetical protein [Novosphingobium sp.]